MRGENASLAFGFTLEEFVASKFPRSNSEGTDDAIYEIADARVLPPTRQLPAGIGISGKRLLLPRSMCAARIIVYNIILYYSNVKAFRWWWWSLKIPYRQMTPIKIQ